MTEPDGEIGRHEESGGAEPVAAIEDAQLAKLEEQERTWLLWVSRLHEHHTRTGSEESRVVLEIAKRRWLAARAALANYGNRGH